MSWTRLQNVTKVTKVTNDDRPITVGDIGANVDAERERCTRLVAEVREAWKMYPRFAESLAHLEGRIRDGAEPTYDE